MTSEIPSGASENLQPIERARALYPLGGNDLGVIAVGDHEGGLVILVDADLPDDLQEVLAGADPESRIIAVHDYQLNNREIGLFDRTMTKAAQGQNVAEEEQEMRRAISYFVQAEAKRVTRDIAPAPNTSWFFDPEAGRSFSNVARAMEADSEWAEDSDS